jgi:hypothetical protein
VLERACSELGIRQNLLGGVQKKALEIMVGLRCSVYRQL